MLVASGADFGRKSILQSRDRFTCFRRYGRYLELDYATFWFRYGYALRGIDQSAIVDLAENPRRVGAKLRSDLLADLWLYHLSYSRKQVPKDQIVKSPRHFLMFKHLRPGVIEIIRILHDSRDLARHLPEA